MIQNQKVFENVQFPDLFFFQKIIRNQKHIYIENRNRGRDHK